MSAVSINHINIKAPRELLAQCRDFYVEVVGLRVGTRSADGDEGFWLYGEGPEAIIHMTIADDRTNKVINHYDHTAFNCHDLPGMIQRLDELSIAYEKQITLDGKRCQVFLKDPCNIGVEFNFVL